MDYIRYPLAGSGGGVTSLNSETGDLTLVAGANITITPSGANITIAATGGSGSLTVGALDSQTKSADGAVISGTSLYMQTADATHPGLLSDTTQVIAGDKTFNGLISAASGIDGQNNDFFNVSSVGRSDGVADFFILGDGGSGIKLQTSGAGNISILTNDNSTSADILIDTVNKSANVNSGNLTLRTGTVSGVGVRGNIILDAALVTANSITKTGGTSASIDVANSRLLDSSQNLVLDWNAKELTDSLGNLVMDWQQKQLYDILGSTSVDWQAHQLLDGTNNNYPAVDYTSRTLVAGASSVILLNWASQRLFDASGVLSVDWGGRTLNDAAGATAASWDSSGVSVTGTLSASNLSGTNTGNITLGAVGSSPSANGASLSGQALTLQPADGTHPGLITSGTQTIGGSKTFASTISASNLSNTNTGDLTLAAVGSSPSANGASLSGQALTLQPFDGTHPGVVPASGGGTSNFLRADGTWTAPAPPTTVAFQAYMAVTSFPAQNTPIIFDTVDSNPNGAYSTSTGLFTAPSTGFYHFDVTITTASASGNEISIYKNGVQYSFLAIATASSGVTGSNIASGGITMSLTVGDTINVADDAAGPNIQGTSPPGRLSVFSGFKVN